MNGVTTRQDQDGAVLSGADEQLLREPQVMGCSAALMAVRLHRARIRMAKTLQALEQADLGPSTARKNTPVAEEIK